MNIVRLGLVGGALQQIRMPLMVADFTVSSSRQVGRCNPAAKLPGRPDAVLQAGAITTLGFFAGFLLDDGNAIRVDL